LWAENSLILVYFEPLFEKKNCASIVYASQFSNGLLV